MYFHNNLVTNFESIDYPKMYLIDNGFEFPGKEDILRPC